MYLYSRRFRRCHHPIGRVFYCRLWCPGLLSTSRHQGLPRLPIQDRNWRLVYDNDKGEKSLKLTIFFPIRSFGPTGVSHDSGIVIVSLIILLISFTVPYSYNLMYRMFNKVIKKPRWYNFLKQLTSSGSSLSKNTG